MRLSPARRRRTLSWLLGTALALTALTVTFRPALTVPGPQALQAGADLLRQRTVLVIVGHPDDLEWYVGGTLRRLADAGAHVHVVVATSGENGPNRTRTPDLPGTRQREQLAAARINGYARVHFLHLPDRGAARDPRFLPAVQAILRDVQPGAVLLFDPDLPSLPYLHADHQGTARAVLTAWRTPGPDRPAVYLFQTRRPDTATDITRVMDTKERALAQHVTQNGGNGSGMRALFGGRSVGVRHAEFFRRLP
ncbi:PIG-L deacetylase family protein [Deinococcus aquiradiocola]|uniref:PIG-L family deacetylase n=1 Tax=Deinococcus aquiradiocola TaxID=393059 RepID=A0A917PIG3_9DEIO|nr:PIG-L deacetylase family protein [Deinococcus aquiradiocola]GGJ79493.1 hypothetical protein GCM10008939_24160 [Deinococcus aquiradiocola]